MTRSRSKVRQTSSKAVLSGKTTIRESSLIRRMPNLPRFNSETALSTTQGPMPPQLPAPRSTPNTRISKRWMVASSVLTLIIAFLLFPHFYNHPSKPAFLSENELFARIGEYVVERSLQVQDAVVSFGKGEEFWRDLSIKFLPSLFFLSTLSSSKTSNEDGLLLGPGRTMAAKGAKAKHPVILIPGIVCSGLEVWHGKPCAAPYFRQRLWGTLNQLRMMLTDKECWAEHMRLDPQTGTDPPGIRVRSAQGLEAADWFVPGVFVLGHVIENLAEVGYDSNNMFMAAYDWRLDVRQLEARDHYFSRLKAIIEQAYHANSHTPVVLLGQSQGALNTFFFLKWLEGHDNQSNSLNPSEETFGAGVDKKLDCQAHPRCDPLFRTNVGCAEECLLHHFW